jgi:exopolysaccharide biosynthesis protein
LKTKSIKRRMSFSGKLTIAVIILFQIISTSFICMMLVYYGPFNVVRNYIVGTAMSSYSHQYLATWFLSKAQIDDILKVNDYNLQQNTGEVTINNTNSKDIQLYNINGAGFEGKLMIVKDPKRIKIGYSSKLGTLGETTSEIATKNKSVAAINGGGFADKSVSGKQWTGTGAYADYFIIADSKIIFKQDSITNNTKANVIAFNAIGELIVGKHSINELLKLNVTQAITFGDGSNKSLCTPLVINGKHAFSGNAGGKSARTAIGQRKNGEILLLVIDGRRVTMPGATIYDVQKIMIDSGAYTATNLDGGASTTMIYNGKVINDPLDPLGERAIPTAICVTQ